VEDQSSLGDGRKNVAPLQIVKTKKKREKKMHRKKKKRKNPWPFLYKKRAG
jgi:hypothetical protein